MKKFNSQKLLFTSLMCLLPILVGFIRFYNFEHVRYCIASGEKTYFVSKLYCISFVPIICLACNIIINLLLDIEGRKIKNLHDFGRWVMPAISIMLQCMYINKVLYDNQNDGNFFILVLVIFLLIYSYYLYNCKLGAYIGVKNKWTTNNWQVWKPTHKILAISLMVYAVILSIAACMDAVITLRVVFGVVILTMLEVMPISKAVYEHQKQKKINMVKKRIKERSKRR